MWRSLPGRAVVLLCTALVASSAAPAVAGPDDGGRIYTGTYGQPVAEFAGCGVVLSTGAVSGITKDGYGITFTVFFDPVAAEGQEGEPIPPCTFSGTVTFDFRTQRPGAPGRTEPFAGDTVTTKLQLRFVQASNEEEALRPKSFEIRICCSGAGAPAGDTCSSCLTTPA